MCCLPSSVEINLFIESTAKLMKTSTFGMANNLAIISAGMPENPNGSMKTKVGA